MRRQTGPRQKVLRVFSNAEKKRAPQPFILQLARMGTLPLRDSSKGSICWMFLKFKYLDVAQWYIVSTFMDVHVAMATSGNAFFQAFQCHMINNPFKVRIMLNYVPRVRSCRTCLTCLTCLGACLSLFLTCLPFYSYLTCLPFLRASCVFIFLLAFIIFLTWHLFLRAFIFYVPYVPSSFYSPYVP